MTPIGRDFYRDNCGLGHLVTAYVADGVNIFFKENLPPLPEVPLVFSEETALPWLEMSEGLALAEKPGRDLASKWELRTYTDNVNFYMSFDKELKEGWELTLKGSAFDLRQDGIQELTVLVFVNNSLIGIWQIDKNSRSSTFKIPQALMKESFEDEVRLFSLTLYIPDVDYSPSAYGLQLEELHIRPSGACRY